MTVPYTREVPNGSSFGVFWKILKLWRGSVYKLVWRELFFYLVIYYSINMFYHYGLTLEQRVVFEDVRSYISKNNASIPLSFVLGFYVSLVVKRWWEQFRLLPWPDTLALFISAAIPGDDEIGRLMRRNVVRYMMLSYVITLRTVSLRVKKRFPEWQHLVDAGFMHESEKKIFELMDAKHPMSKYWMPLVWATNIINRARKENLIQSDHLVQTLLLELSDIRVRLSGIHGYDFVCVPLVYTQVVTIALYTYFGAAILGSNDEFDFYFPVFLVLQFIFYVGWLKVAEVLINPWGEDDDDIELNWFIDRHIKAAYMIVDEMHMEHPELLKDQFWDEVVPKELLYTVGSEHYRRFEPKGSAEDYKVKDNEAIYSNLGAMKAGQRKDSCYADYEFIKSSVPTRKNWLSRHFTRMGSNRSLSSLYSTNRGFKNYKNSIDGRVLDTRLQIPNSGRSSPSKSRKSSIYERIMGFNSRKSSTVPDLSIAMLSHPAYKGNSTTFNNKPVIGRLFLTPMNEESITNGISSAPTPDANKMPTATLLLEASKLAQQQLQIQNDKLSYSDKKKTFAKEDFKSISEIDDDTDEKQEVFV